MKNAAPNRFYHNGHTLIEVMLSIAIMLILSTITFPAVTTMMNKASIKSTRQILMQDIRLLRSHARTQHAAAYLCAVSENECVQTNHWKNGWFGFLDHNQSGKFDEGDKVVVENKPSIQRNINIIIHTRWQNIKIDQQGIIRSSGHFRICDANKTREREMKVIRMNVHGRLRIEPDTLDCT